MTVRLNGQELPTGWASVTLDKIVDLDVGCAFKSSEFKDDGIRLLRGDNIEPGALRWNNTRYWSLDDIKNYQHLLIDVGDIILAMDRPLISSGLKIARAKMTDVPCLLVQRVARFRPRCREMTEYLYQTLLTQDFINHLLQGQTGTQLPHISAKNISSFVILLPPLNEQHRIVAAIETQFTRLDAAVTALKRSQANLKRYRAAVLKAACEGRLVPTEAELAQTEGRSYEPASVLLERILTERRRKWAAENPKKKYQEPVAPDTSALPELPEGWCWATFGQSTEHRLGKMLDKAKNKGTLRPYLRNINVRWFTFDLSDLQYMRVTDSELRDVTVEQGDLIVCEGGEPGRSSVWNRSGESIVIQKALHRVRPYNGIVSWYLAYCLAADASNGRLESFFTGSTIKHFTGESLDAHAIPLPPLAEQQRIVAEVERRLSLIDQLEKTIETDLARANRLRQSILQRAFAGQLVPQDPTDEPAAILLERIQATKHGQPVQTALL